jgi:hypothetical protein
MKRRAVGLALIAALGMVPGVAVGLAFNGHRHARDAVVRCPVTIQEDMANRPILVDYPGATGEIVYRCRLNP